MFIILRIYTVILLLQYGLPLDAKTPGDPESPQVDACSESAPADVNCSLSRIFQAYGVSSEIHFEGFEHLLEHVHAANFYFNHTLKDHVDNLTNQFIPKHITHDHQPWFSETDEEDNEQQETPSSCCPCKEGVGENAAEHREHKHMERSSRRKMRKREMGETVEVPELPTLVKAKCYSPKEIMASVKLTMDDRITPGNFKEICPVILDQIDRGTCLSEPSPSKRKAKKKDDEEWSGISFPPLYVWLIALGAVFTISVLGFVIVAILPLMYSVFYNYLQQFLVAMAVGTLSGDAILHLIPHAFFPHGDEEEGEEESEGEGEDHEAKQRQLIYFGTLILLGILLLYVIEQIINIFPQEMEKKRLEKERAKYKQQFSSPPRLYLSASSYYVGEKLGNPHTQEGEDSYGNYSGNIGRSKSGLSERQRFCYPFYGSCNDIVFRLQSRSKSNLMASALRPLSVAENCSDADAANPEAAKFLPRSSGSLDHSKFRPEKRRYSERPGNTLPSSFSKQSKQFTKPETITSDSSDDQEKTTQDNRPHNHQRSQSNAGIGENGHCYHKRESNAGHMHSHGHSHGLSHGLLSAQHQTDDDTDFSIPPKSKPPLKHKLSLEQAHGHSHELPAPTKSQFIVESDTEAAAGHGHVHGHSHNYGGGSCTGTAVMVAFADVFHNFIDGMAIGAAFTQRLAGGLSTSIAVCLHELPHELGDFALLLQEGLSIKRGLCLNALSSVICLVGVAIGVGLGAIPMFNQFIFSLAAGMFLYVSLVTMLPQVSSIKTRPDQNPYRHLTYQLLGILSGIGLMFLIAIYEERLQEAIVGVVNAIGLVESDEKNEEKSSKHLNQYVI